MSRSSPHRSGSPLRPGACHENLLFRVCRAMGSRTAPPPPESSGHGGWRLLRWAQHRPVWAVVMDVAVRVGPCLAGGSGEATGLRLPRWPWAWVVDSEDGQARPSPRTSALGPGSPSPRNAAVPASWGRRQPACRSPAPAVCERPPSCARSSAPPHTAFFPGGEGRPAESHRGDRWPQLHCSLRMTSVRETCVSRAVFGNDPWPRVQRDCHTLGDGLGSREMIRNGVMPPGPPGQCWAGQLHRGPIRDASSLCLSLFRRGVVRYLMACGPRPALGGSCPLSRGHLLGPRGPGLGQAPSSAVGASARWPHRVCLGWLAPARLTPHWLLLTGAWTRTRFTATVRSCGWRTC